MSSGSFQYNGQEIEYDYAIKTGVALVRFYYGGETRVEYFAVPYWTVEQFVRQWIELYDSLGETNVNEQS